MRPTLRRLDVLTLLLLLLSCDRFGQNVSRVWRVYFSETKSLPQLLDFHYRIYTCYLSLPGQQLQMRRGQRVYAEAQRLLSQSARRGMKIDRKSAESSEQDGSEDGSDDEEEGSQSVASKQEETGGATFLQYSTRVLDRMEKMRVAAAAARANNIRTKTRASKGSMVSGSSTLASASIEEGVGDDGSSTGVDIVVTVKRKRGRPRKILHPAPSSALRPAAVIAIPPAHHEESNYMEIDEVTTLETDEEVEAGSIPVLPVIEEHVCADSLIEMTKIIEQIKNTDRDGTEEVGMVMKKRRGRPPKHPSSMVTSPTS
jgi:hypothetical protein